RQTEDNAPLPPPFCYFRRSRRRKQKRLSICFVNYAVLIVNFSRNLNKLHARMSYGRPPPRIEGMVSLKVDNLTYRTTPEDLRRAFERCGEVGDIYIPRDRFTRESRGFAFVRLGAYTLDFVGSTTRGMLKTHWMPWMVVCWMEGSCVCKWPATEDLRLRIEDILDVREDGG
ncbi:serine/arginine-rich splicing factor, partial [Rhyzopertha dominica]